MPDKMRFYIEEQISENISTTPEGFLLCQNCPITRIGEFLYKDGEVPIAADKNGIIRIQRDADEVFKEEAINSFNGKPITVNHPDGFVDPDNWSDLAVGTVQNVRRGEGNQRDLVIADLLITRSDAIELVNAGLRELSCGYDAEYSEISPGLGKQTQIVGNHVALVMKGRAGARCKINDKKTCDSCDNCKCNDNRQEDKKMTFKDRLNKWLNQCPIKDEDKIGEEDIEDVKEDVKVKDKKMKDNVEEEKKMKKEEMEDEEGEEAEVLSIQQLAERIANLESIIDALVASDKEVHEAMDKKFKDEEEVKEEEKEEAKKLEEETKDCEAQWPDLVYRAEVLCPGVELRKPTKDHKKELRKIKIAILTAAATKKPTKDSIDAFTQGKELEKLSTATLDAAFVGASELVAKLNNAKIQMPSINMQKFSVASNVHSINQKNKDFYKTA